MKILKHVSYLVIAILVGATAVYATSKLTPPSTPSNTMYSLEDIYNLAHSGTSVSEGTGDFVPGTLPVSETGKTLTEVYEAVASAMEHIVTPPTFALTDATQYKCEWLTVDPAQPAVTLETICGYHAADGCSWTGSVCDGGDALKTPNSGYMTWHAAKASCANSTAEGQTVGTWRLPTYPELVGHYLDDNIGGGPPTDFQSGYYWSGTTLPAYSNGAYGVTMDDGIAYYDNKSVPYNLVHCAR